MIDFDFLPRGLHAMARAHHLNTMSGHLGAALVAGYFIGEQHPGLDKIVCDGIEGELKRVVDGESVFSPKKGDALTAAAMFEPFPKEKPQANLIEAIADALSKNIDRARASGHNVIFASIAIRALKDHPDLAIPSVVEGIGKLISAFDGSSPGSGYYGKEKGRINGRAVALPKLDGDGLFPDLSTMANVVIDELIKNAQKRREGYGGMWHIIDHAAALTELSRYGYHEIAIRGLPAFDEHYRLFQTLPDISQEKGAETPTEDDPLNPKFWRSEKIRRQRAHLTHRIKTLYAFHQLAELVESKEKRDRGSDKLRYLM